VTNYPALENGCGARVVLPYMRRLLAMNKADDPNVAAAIANIPNDHLSYANLRLVEAGFMEREFDG
jgi:hypothetical protein